MKNIAEEIVSFEECLYLEEKSENTIKKYIRDVNAFSGFLGIKNNFFDKSINKDLVLRYKSYLKEKYNIRKLPK